MSRIVFELFGAGEAARTIAVELAMAGAARITIVNRRNEPAELAELIAQRTGAQADAVPWLPQHRVDAQSGIVVNAGSIGLFPDVGAMPGLDTDSLRPGVMVVGVMRTRHVRR